jgi:hypothetical protein
MNIIILYYIEKIETYLHEYIFKIYVYIKFASYLMSNYYLKLQDYIYVWNSIKFVNQNWFSYNSKIYSHNNIPNINY